MVDKDHLIVGWGLAGATLAWQLYFESISFHVFDSSINHTTRSAAGIVNPIVFKRLTKGWNVDKLIPYAESFYAKVESELNTTIIHQKHIFKIINSYEEENNWASKQLDENFNSYLAPLTNPKIEGVDAPFGFGEVKTFGHLDTNAFLDLSKSFFLNKNINFTHELFDYSKYNKVTNTYNDEHIKHIYFCEGFKICNNPFFNYLPLKPTHGETLIIQTHDFNFDHVLNKNMFILKINDHTYKVGATYNWELEQPITTANGKNELIERLKNIVDFEYTIIDHQAGIRPTVKDRRPLIGQHPNYNNLFLFNGLGTKGVMIAPYYANQLLASISNSLDLDNEVNIDRYKKYLH